MRELVEIWKPIMGYEGFFEVSNLGRVRSLDRYDNLKHFRKGGLKKLSKDKDGYLKVGLFKDGKQKLYFVHRLVAQAFLPNPNNQPQVNHKNEKKDCNIVSNLEWCDGTYNQNYGTINNRRGKSLSVKVIQYDLNMNLIRLWDSMKYAADNLNVNYQNISKCCRGVRKQFNGSIWKYYDTDTYLIALMNKTIKERERAA